MRIIRFALVYLIGDYVRRVVASFSQYFLRKLSLNRHKPIGPIANEERELKVSSYFRKDQLHLEDEKDSSTELCRKSENAITEKNVAEGRRTIEVRVIVHSPGDCPEYAESPLHSSSAKVRLSDDNNVAALEDVFSERQAEDAFSSDMSLKENENQAKTEAESAEIITRLDETDQQVGITADRSRLFHQLGKLQ
ncbi:hypothetical protein Aperf_G00000051036 [Anoplocephala perfoliata]